MEMRTSRLVGSASPWRTLLCLYDEARQDRGWRRRGVRGWRFYAEMGVLMQARMNDTLPPLVHKGLAERIDVRYPGRVKSEWIYRITPSGVASIASHLDGPPAELPVPSEDDPDEGSIYLTAPMWRIAEALREQSRLEIGKRRWGVHGWMRPSEIKRASGAVISNELTILQELRMAERRDNPVIVGHRRVPLWRITARGAAMALIDAAAVGGERALFAQVKLQHAGPGARDAEQAWAPLLRPNGQTEPGVGGGVGPPVVKVVGMDSGPKDDAEER